jgi:hypothetical protein
MWLVAAAGEAAAPVETYEFLAHAVPPGAAAKAFLAVAVAVEAALGVAMILRAVQGFALSLAGIALGAATLAWVRAKAPFVASCGCFGGLLATSVDTMLHVDLALAAVLVGLIVWSRKRDAA